MTAVISFQLRLIFVHVLMKEEKIDGFANQRKKKGIQKQYLLLFGN